MICSGQAFLVIVVSFFRGGQTSFSSYGAAAGEGPGNINIFKQRSTHRHPTVRLKLTSKSIKSGRTRRKVEEL